MMNDTRSRTVINREEVMHVDNETGEVKRDTITNTFKVSSEPEFIKIYYTHVLADYMKPEGKMSKYIDFLVEIAPSIRFADEGQVFFVNKLVKQQIAKHLGVQERQVTNYITDMVKLGILHKLTRGMYCVNPFVIGKGSWKDVEKLRYTWEADSLMGESTAVQAELQADDGRKANLTAKSNGTKVRASLNDGEQTTIYDFLPKEKL